MNTVFNATASKSFQSALSTNTAEGCVSKSRLAEEVRKQFGRGADQEALETWIGCSVKLGLFDTDEISYNLMRGRTGGIYASKRRARKAKATQAAA